MSSPAPIAPSPPPATPVSRPEAPPFQPDPELIANAEGDERARRRTVAAAKAAHHAGSTDASQA